MQAYRKNKDRIDNKKQFHNVKERSAQNAPKRSLGQNFFTNQTLAQIELATNHTLEKKVYTLPKKLDEEVARLHLGSIWCTCNRNDRWLLASGRFSEGFHHL